MLKVRQTTNRIVHAAWVGLRIRCYYVNEDAIGQ